VTLVATVLRHSAGRPKRPTCAVRRQVHPGQCGAHEWRAAGRPRVAAGLWRRLQGQQRRVARAPRHSLRARLLAVGGGPRSDAPASRAAAVCALGTSCGRGLLWARCKRCALRLRAGTARCVAAACCALLARGGLRWRPVPGARPRHASGSVGAPAGDARAENAQRSLGRPAAACAARGSY